MKGILAIFRRELNGYFVSPIAYIVIGAFLVAAGFVFTIILSSVMQYAMMAQAQAARSGAPPDIDVPIQVIRRTRGGSEMLSRFVLGHVEIDGWFGPVSGWLANRGPRAGSGRRF